jgi:hypothetical protein
MHASLLLVFPALFSGLAPVGATQSTLAAAQRKTAVEGLVQALRTHYVSPELAERSARKLLQTLARGGYGQESPDALAQALTADLQTVTGDRHLRVHFDPDFQGSIDPDAEPPPDVKAEFRRSLARQNFGVNKAEILPGNVGLLDLRFFAPVEFSASTIAAAMALLSSTEALIIDLRQNDGGDPETIAFLCTYFFPVGSRIHLNDLQYRRKNELRQFWTQSSVPGPRYGKRPIYVLTSARTVSGGEELSYDLQALKRGTVLGETTAGAANAGGAMAVGGGFAAFIPTGRAVNPITKTNWEGVGVKPDVPVPAERALEAAHARALRAILKSEADGEYRKQLSQLLSLVERGEQVVPLYKRRDAHLP